MKLKPLNLSQTSAANQRCLVVVLDGVGVKEPFLSFTNDIMAQEMITQTKSFFEGNSVNSAYMPFLADLIKNHPYRTVYAHGTYVGLPSNDDMGNSEVGHNALGAGRIIDQGAKLVNRSIESKSIFETPTWIRIVKRPELFTGDNTLHLGILLSDGNVHSHIDHLFNFITQAKNDGVKKVRLHILLDGRDVPPRSALDYIEQLDNFLSRQNNSHFDCRCASGGGRMTTTMDRYESDWSIVERGYYAHVHGTAQHYFQSLYEAVETLRSTFNLDDQFLPDFVITDSKQNPIGKVTEGDSFIWCNYRGDRALQFCQAMTAEKFEKFERKNHPKIHFAGIMQYDGDLNIPPCYLVNPPSIDNTMTEIFSLNGVKQFACSETQKFGHVTYFWNGNRSDPFNPEFEYYVEIESDLVPFEQRPWMKAAEITDATIQAIEANTFQIGRINFANGDMVGHTGDFRAAIIAMQTVDLCLERLVSAAQKNSVTLVITADHGNADEMYEIDKKTKKPLLEKQKVRSKTSHTLNPVPVIIVPAPTNQHETFEWQFRNNLPQAGLANIAATVFNLAGYEAPENYEPSLIEWVQKQHKNKDKSASLRDTLLQNSKIDGYELARKSLEFAKTIEALRSEQGCPWDQEQTIDSLTRYLVEETYECVQAAHELTRNPTNATLREAFKEELGDVLLQVALNSQIANENGMFNLADVFDCINTKMIDRHPHVFADKHANSAAEVAEQWQKQKKETKGLQTSLLEKAIRKSHLPSLNYGYEISKLARKIGFAWENLDQVFEQFLGEVEELRIEISQKPINRARVIDEMGDVLFTLCNLSVFLNEHQDQALDLDQIARQSIQKFVTRFQTMEDIAAKAHISWSLQHAQSLTLEQWNEYWRQAKQHLAKDV